jgi:hypothetical protein
LSNIVWKIRNEVNHITAAGGQVRLVNAAPSERTSRGGISADVSLVVSKEMAFMANEPPMA